MRTKEEIRTIIVKNMRGNISNLDEQPVDTAKSMIEYGADSLDTMEIVSSSLREVDLKVPRTELAHLRNIDDLVELLWSRQSGSSQSPSREKGAEANASERPIAASATPPEPAAVIDAASAKGGNR